MPPKSQLVAESVDRFDYLGMRSTVLDLDKQTLIDLGLRIVEPNCIVRELWEWLNDEMGKDDDEPVVNERALRRFVDRFRDIYAQVHGEHVRRITHLTIEHVSDGNIATMAQALKGRLVTLVADKLCETNSLDAVTSAQVNSAISLVANLESGKIKEAELALKTAESERRALKLEAELARMQAQLQQLQAENEAREAKRQQAASQVKAQIDQARDSDTPLTPAAVYDMVDRVMRGAA